MIVLGLTGSIGMGKSTTAKMFADAGVPVHDSDSAVHRLYRGVATGPIEARFPGTVINGVVDREKLAAAVLGNPDALRDLERIVHPLVRADADEFVVREREAGTKMALLDTPLLFETNGEARVDKIVVVTAPYEVQRERVMMRPGMTEEKFAAILARQLPDVEKRARADFVIDTGLGLDAAEAAVRKIIAELASGEKLDA
jgi:dephospho-CoA kinase